MNKYPSWFIGVIAGLDDEQNIKQTKGGVRYRVRRYGIDKLDEPVGRLLFFDCLLPLTAGTGDNLKAKSVVLSVGDLVFGMHTDAPDHQRGVILGAFPRTALINYDEFTMTEDLTTASGGDQSTLAQPSPINKGRSIVSLTADSDLEKDNIEAVKKGADTTKNETPPITVNNLPSGWRVVEGGFVEDIGGRVVGEVNEDGTINTD